MLDTLYFFFNICYHNNGEAMRKKAYSLLQVILIIFISSIISGLTIGVIINKNNEASDTGTVEHSPELQTFINAYNNLLKDYYEEIDEKQLVNSAINGMASYLNDTYTAFLDSSSAGNLIKQLDGEYVGIGIKHSGNTIIEVLPGSPAEKAGIQVNDVISTINEVEVSAENVNYLLELVNNSKEKIDIGILRFNQSMLFTIKVEPIQIQNVISSVIENTNIGYIKIKAFARSVSALATEELKRLVANNISGIIVDLRGNTGGYLDEAFSTSSLFTPDNAIIYSISSSKGKKSYYDNNSYSVSVPIIILTNGSTASAAEIMVAALKDNNMATIVGTKTYGKGKVQHTYQLDGGGIFKYTSSKWLRPNGECIDNVGIIPDIEVSQEYTYNYETGEISNHQDTQLLKAIELLSK